MCPAVGKGRWDSMLGFVHLWGTTATGLSPGRLTIMGSQVVKEVVVLKALVREGLGDFCTAVVLATAAKVASGLLVWVCGQEKVGRCKPYVFAMLNIAELHRQTPLFRQQCGSRAITPSKKHVYM